MFRYLLLFSFVVLLGGCQNDGDDSSQVKGGASNAKVELKIPKIVEEKVFSDQLKDGSFGP